MKNRIIFSMLLLAAQVSAQQDQSQSPWHIQARNIDPSRYFGITVANGMIGLVSSPEPMRVQDVVLNGAYDYYQRGRVSNILKTFNHLNMNLDVDGRRIGRRDISNYAQTLDMQTAVLLTTFDVGDQLSVRHSMLALRHLPYTALSVVEITAKKDVTITPMSVIEAPVRTWPMCAIITAKLTARTSSFRCSLRWAKVLPGATRWRLPPVLSSRSRTDRNLKSYTKTGTTTCTWRSFTKN
jgi:hypothetical protein